MQVTSANSSRINVTVVGHRIAAAASGRSLGSDETAQAANGSSAAKGANSTALPCQTFSLVVSGQLAGAWPGCCMRVLVRAAERDLTPEEDI